MKPPGCDPLFSKSWDEICDWERQIAFCDVIDLPEIERKRAKEGFGYLREAFGADFLKEGLQSRHSLIRTIGNQAPWTRQWVGWLAETVRGVEDRHSREDIIKRLRNANSYEEALSVLKVMYQFAAAGFRCAIDPAVIIREVEKRPDLLFTDAVTGEKLYVEVTETRTSDESERANRTLRTIWNLLIWKSSFVSHCGVIHRILDDANLSMEAREVNRIVEKAVEEGGLHDIADGALEMAVVRKDDEDLLRPWAESRGLSINAVIGPRYDKNPIRRVLSKIGRKQRQLPRDVPSIVFIWSPWLLIQARDIEVVAAALADRAEEYAHVLAVVVAGEWLGPGDEQLRALKGAVYLSTRQLDVLERRTLAVFNPGCCLRVSSALRRRINRALGLDSEECDQE